MTPYPDRTVSEWRAELAEDVHLISMYVDRATNDDESDEDKIVAWALALKEARRLTSDIYRMARKAGVRREKIDEVGPL